MISVDESWQSIFNRLGLGPIRGTRAKRCPFPDCESSSGFSISENKGGVFNCFKCGRHGDKIRFVQDVSSYDFKSALLWLGLTPGVPPTPDPAMTRRQRIREGLRRWAETTGRQLRYEHYVRERVCARAEERLQRNAEDEWGWAWLAWALPGQEQIAFLLDLLEGDEAEQLQAYREMRAAA